MEKVLTRYIGTPNLWKLETYRSLGGYKTLEKALREYQPDDIVTIVRDAGLREAIRVLEILGVTGDGEDGNGSRRRVFAQRAAELESIHAGHCQIGEHRLGTEVARFFERLMPVVRIDGAEAVVLQVLAVHHPRAQIVLDDQDQRIGGGCCAALGLHSYTPSLRL